MAVQQNEKGKANGQNQKYTQPKNSSQSCQGRMFQSQKLNAHKSQIRKSTEESKHIKITKGSEIKPVTVIIPVKSNTEQHIEPQHTVLSVSLYIELYAPDLTQRTRAKSQLDFPHFSRRSSIEHVLSMRATEREFWVHNRLLVLTSQRNDPSLGR